MPDPMTPERPRCGTPCLKHAHACDRSPRHTGFHRDVQQKGENTCEWSTPGPKDFPALMAALRTARAELAEADHVVTVTGEKLTAVRGQRDRAEAERDEARAERIRVINALGSIGRAAVIASGDLEDGVNAELLAASAELAAYHAAAESTDLEGDVGDHLTPLADWQTENGTAPEWLIDAVIGLIAPVKAERDRLAEQVKRARELHSPEENPRRVRDCKGCRTDVSFVPYEKCPTIRALDGTGDGS